MAIVTSRWILGIFLLLSLAGCSPELRIEIFNNTAETVTVAYWRDEITIAPMSIGILDVRLGSERLTVKYDSIEKSYPIGFGSLPGRCYEPGLRHTVRIQIDSKGVLFVLSNDQGFLVTEGHCGRYEVAG